jgi:hypothetical protein
LHLQPIIFVRIDSSILDRRRDSTGVSRLFENLLRKISISVGTQPNDPSVRHLSCGARHQLKLIQHFKDIFPTLPRKKSRQVLDNFAATNFFRDFFRKNAGRS